MEKINTERLFMIKNGNNSKSIFHFVNSICKEFLNSSSDNFSVQLKAYENNMNKLITIVEILKRHLKESISVRYQIGLEGKKNYIQSFLSLPHQNEFVKKTLNDLVQQNNNSKRNPLPNNIMKIDDDVNHNENKDKITTQDLCFENVNEFFI